MSVLAVAAAVAIAFGESSDIGVLLRAGALVHGFVHDGEWWRLVSCIFVHIGGLLLLVNTIGLWFVGRLCDELFGSARTIAIFAVAGIAGAGASYVASPGAVTAGASGAIFGLLGAVFVELTWHRRQHRAAWNRGMWGSVLVVAVAQVGIGFLYSTIDQWAHGGGLALGSLMGFVLSPHARWAKPARFVARAIAIAFGIAVAVSAVMVARTSVADSLARPATTQITIGDRLVAVAPASWVVSEDGVLRDADDIINLFKRHRRAHHRTSLAIVRDLLAPPRPPARGPPASRATTRRRTSIKSTSRPSAWCRCRRAGRAPSSLSRSSPPDPDRQPPALPRRRRRQARSPSASAGRLVSLYLPDRVARDVAAVLHGAAASRRCKKWGSDPATSESENGVAAPFFTCAAGSPAYARSVRLVLVLAAILMVACGLAGTAAADPKLGDCFAELDARHVAWKHASRPGIQLGVELTGTIGGIHLTSEDQPLVIDCSLAVSLDEAGKYMRALGIDKATFSSAYSRRNVRGTNRPSKHSYGLAIDVHTFTGDDLGTLRVDRDYEQGLGDDVDCVGAPMTEGGAILKTLQCQLVRSGLFYLVLSPDYDDAHHDHFHLEVTPWAQRTALRAAKPAIH